MKPTHQAIAERARQNWEAAGCPTGRDDEFWLHAEQLLQTQPASPAPAPAPSPAAPPPIPQSPAHAVPPVLKKVVQPTARPKKTSAPKKRHAS